jgi:hypothetical protein
MVVRYLMSLSFAEPDEILSDIQNALRAGLTRGGTRSSLRFAGAPFDVQAEIESWPDGTGLTRPVTRPSR